MKDPSELSDAMNTEILTQIQKIIWPTKTTKACDNSDDVTVRDLESFDAIVALLFTVGLAP